MSWETVSLGDLIDLQNGYSFKSSEYAEEGYFLMRITNVQQGFVSKHNPKYVSIPINSKLKQFILNEGDILMSLTGDVGRVGIISKNHLPAALNQRVARVIIKSENKVQKKYLFTLLNSEKIRKEIEGLAHGAAQLNVSTKDILGIKVSIPPLTTQQKIVDKLDVIFAEIHKATVATEQNIKNAEAIFCSYLNLVFKSVGEDWVSDTIGNVCTLRSGTTVNSMLEKTEGELPYLKVADMNLISNQDSITTSSRFLNISDVSKNSIICRGSTIFPKRGGAIDTNKKRITNVDIAVDLNIMSVFPSDKLIPYLVYFYFLGLDMRKLGSGASIRQINNYDIEPLTIRFPKSLDAQKNLVDIMSNLKTQTEKMANNYKNKITELIFLKEAILQRAFNGELAKE